MRTFPCLQLCSVTDSSLYYFCMHPCTLRLMLFLSNAFPEKNKLYTKEQ